MGREGRGRGRTLTASFTSPQRLPVVSTWYIMRFEGDGGVGEEVEEDASVLEGCEDEDEDMVVDWTVKCGAARPAHAQALRWSVPGPARRSRLPAFLSTTTIATGTSTILSWS